HLDLTLHPSNIKTASLSMFELDANLVIQESCFFRDTFYSSINASICYGETFEGYSSSGVYADTFEISTGCDSIRILHLSVGTKAYLEVTAQVCSGHSYEGYFEPGIYRDTF